MAGRKREEQPDPLLRLRKERKSLSNTRVSLGSTEAYAYNKEQTHQSMREMISTQIRPVARELENGIEVKKVDIFIRQEELPHLSVIKTDSDMEPEPLENDYLIRLKVQLDTIRSPDVGPVGLQVHAKFYRWEEGHGGLHKLGIDQVNFGMMDEIVIPQTTDQDTD